MNRKANKKEYLDEMSKRFGDMESGKVKSLSLDEIEQLARQAYKNKKKKNRQKD